MVKVPSSSAMRAVGVRTRSVHTSPVAGRTENSSPCSAGHALPSELQEKPKYGKGVPRFCPPPCTQSKTATKRCWPLWEFSAVTTGFSIHSCAGFTAREVLISVVLFVFVGGSTTYGPSMEDAQARETPKSPQSKKTFQVLSIA